MSQPNSPQPSSQDMNPAFSQVYLSSYENEDDLEANEEEVEALSRLPSFSAKRPRSVAIDELDEEPDLADFFSYFPHFSEADQVKYCRAYASMLAAKSAKNRLRMGHGRNPFPQ